MRLNEPIVALLPGCAPRILGVSARTRNERVIGRVGAVPVPHDSLDAYGNRLAILVPAGIIIDAPLFPVDQVTTPTRLIGTDGAVVVAGPARELQRLAIEGWTAERLPERQVSAAGVLDVATRRTRRRAAWSILKRTGKPTDGWVSRNCSRPMSRVISYVLLSLRLKANHASLLTLAVGLGSAALALRPGYLPLVGSGVLFQLASMLDGVDGEMARATLTESASGALLDTVVDLITYVAFFLGVTVGWVREGAGASALLSISVIAVALVLSLMRAGRFVSRHAPNASFVFIDRSVRRAARDSERVALKIAAALFTLLRRDAFAALFFFVALAGYRVLVPALVAPGIVLANLTFSRYRKELAAAAVAELGSIRAKHY